MKQKRFTAAVVIAMMITLLLPVCNVSAAEITIFNWVNNNDYVNHQIHTNWMGQASSQCPGYSTGEKWATAWGGEGWYTDAEDGSLAFTANPEKKSNEESYLGRRIVTEALPDNSELILTLKFRTAPQPKGSAAEVWFVLNSQEEGLSKETQANSFMLKNSMTAEMEHGFASTTSWPFTKKIPDRDPNTISFDYDKDYEVEITLKPALTSKDVYRYVAKIKEDGSDKGTIIVNEWPGFKPSQAKKPVQLTIATINRTDVREQEPVMFLKGISMKAKLSNAPLKASFFPEDNSRNVELDTKCYAEFEKAVETIEKSQVSITGDAVVENVNLKDGTKLDIELSNLKPKTAYTVTVKNVKGVTADNAFDYSWSFTTDSGLTFSKPYYSLIDEKVSVNSFDDFYPVAVTDEDYENGAWGTAILQTNGLISDNAVDFNKVSDEFRVEDGYLWGYTHSQTSKIAGRTDGCEDRTVSKHFEPISDGAILNVSATIRYNWLSTTNAATHYVGSSIELSGENGNIALIQYGFNPWDQTVRFLNDGGANYYQQTHKNTDVVTTGEFRWTYAPKALNGNDIFSSKGADSKDYIYAFANKQGDMTALDGDITLTLTAKPSEADSSKYDLTLVTAGPNIDAVSTRTVDKSLVLGLTDFHMVTSRSDTTAVINYEKLIALKEVKISSPEGGLLPEVGESNVYIDYKNIAETAANAEILVVEKDAETGKILSLHLKSLSNITGSGTAAIPVVLEEAGSKLEIYALNSAGGMVLLAEPDTVDVIE